jgi:nucleotide-binding universal stress UspA family protein
MRTRERRAGRTPVESGGISAPGPVVLGTLSSRFEPEAEQLAIESAIEAGVALLVVNAMPPTSMRALLFRGHRAAAYPRDEDYGAVRATAQRAARRGLRVEHLRIMSPRPPKALVQVAHERGAGLLVLGPSRTRVPRWRFRQAAREVRRHAACLVWLAD